jgi:hypothetical protein
MPHLVLGGTKRITWSLSMPRVGGGGGSDHRVHIFTQDETGSVYLPLICPLSWSVHCNFTADGKCNERGWSCTPHPHQPGLILTSWWNVRQKAAVTTLWIRHTSMKRSRLSCDIFLPRRAICVSDSLRKKNIVYLWALAAPTRPFTACASPRKTRHKAPSHPSQLRWSFQRYL